MRKFRINWKRIKGSEYASLMMRLAMAVNDISTNFLLSDLVREQEKNPSAKVSHPMLRTVLGDPELSKGFQFYAFRMLIGHFCEGMKIISLVKKQEEGGNKELQWYLARLHPETAADYAFLKNLWVKASPDEAIFKKLRLEVRDSVCFHYEKDDEYITKTIADIADRDNGSTTSFIQGNDISTSRIYVADTVILHAIADCMWEAISEDEKDTAAKIDEGIAWCSVQCKRLYRVGFELCGMYFAEKSV